VIGGGVVGCAVAHALARRGAAAVVLEAESDLALGASGANSGILHTGFDSTPGELETRLILRSAAIRDAVLDELGVPVLRCGASLAPGDREQAAAVRRLARNARANGVRAELRDDGSLSVPGEAVTDPVALVRALADGARQAGGEIRLDTRVAAIERVPGGLAVELDGGERLPARAVVNCAGLFADEVARMAGDELASIYPRKGEFLVFAMPAGAALERILLPVPSPLGKGVLVFPTVDGHLIAGPTAREREDKRDWSVEADAAQLILPKAVRMYPPLEGAEPIAAYAGLRPAGRDANYVIERSRALPGAIHVAAIRSTGLSAALGIAEHVLDMLAEPDGALELGPKRRPTATGTRSAGPWWRRAADRAGAPARGLGAR
jgi:glycerol-3-phosphate dehydrogenase